MSEKRINRRYSVDADRAQATIVIDQQPHKAVLAEMSASGFGVLVFRGVRVQPGQVLTLATDETLFECEVAHARPEDTFQHVGLRRLRETSLATLPPMQSLRSWYRETVQAGGPLVFVAVVCGFAGLVVLALMFMESRSSGHSAKSKQAQAQEFADQSDPQPRLSAADRARLREKAALQARELAQKVANELAAKQKSAAEFLTGSPEVTWKSLVERLKMSKEQQDWVLNASSVSASESTEARHERALRVLSDEQKTSLKDVSGRNP